MFRSSRRASRAALAELVARTDGLQPWRRVVHAGLGLGLAGALVVFEPARWVAVTTLSLLAGIQLGFDGLRLRVPRINQCFFRVMRPLLSPREVGGVASSTWYVLGCLVAVAAFPTDVAISAILVLALADPAAAWIGRVRGRHPFGSGTVEGSLVFALVAFGLLVPRHGLLAAAVTAPVVALVERARWPIDDNLATPVTVGGTLWVLEHLGA